MIAKGRHVADIGAAIAGPTLRVASPIVVHGQSAGKVEAEVSLTPLLIQIGALTLLGIALGGAVFFGALLLPQRALREATAAHEEVQRDLRLQIAETQSALMVAKEATNAKSAFLAMMSHEIRTPMNAVMGLSSSLQELRLDTEQRHLVDTIYEFEQRPVAPAQRHSRFLQARRRQDRARDDRVLARGAARSCGEHRGGEGRRERPRHPRRDRPDLPAALVGDPARLQQVVLNLAVNAIKFTENGAIEVGARCLQQSADAATIECWVRDTGIGIAPEHIAQAVQRILAGRALDQPPLRRHRPRPCDLASASSSGCRARSTSPRRPAPARPSRSA